MVVGLVMCHSCSHGVIVIDFLRFKGEGITSRMKNIGQVSQVLNIGNSIRMVTYQLSISHTSFTRQLTQEDYWALYPRVILAPPTKRVGATRI